MVTSGAKLGSIVKLGIKQGQMFHLVSLISSHYSTMVTKSSNGIPQMEPQKLTMQNYLHIILSKCYPFFLALSPLIFLLSKNCCIYFRYYFNHLVLQKKAIVKISIVSQENVYGEFKFSWSLFLMVF